MAVVGLAYHLGGRWTGGTAGNASDGDEFEGAGEGASRYADQYGQPGVDVQETGSLDGGGTTGGASDRDKGEGAGEGASLDADQYGQSCVHHPRPRKECRGGQAHDRMCTTTDSRIGH